MGKPKVPVPVANPGTVKYTQTFSFYPAMAIGEPFNDKVIVSDLAKGKQMKIGRFHGADAQTMYASEATQATVGNTSTSLFKMAPSLFCAADKKGKEPYVDVDRYTTQFPNGDFRPKGCAKRGFGTSDFRAVDKYANTINTERLRETLKKEQHLVKKIKAENDKRMSEAGIDASQHGMGITTSQALAQQKLFDVVHRQQPTSFKHKRDDSQMRYVYMNQRRKEQGLEPHPRFQQLHGFDTQKLHQENLFAGTSVPVSRKDPTWVQIKLPTGALVNVLVDENDQIVARDAAGAGSGDLMG